MNVSDWPWQHWCSQRPEDIAVTLNHERLSWRALCARIDQLAAGFYQQGVRESDGVALCARNGVETLLAWLALLQCGARLLPLNPQLPAAEQAALLPEIGLRFALVLDGEPLPGLAVLRLQPTGTPWAVPWRPLRLATMTLTSGSSGRPKAAVHTLAAHLTSARGVLSLIAYAPGDSWLLSLPLFHVSGQGILWRWLLAGAQLVVRDKQPLADALAGCTHASLVPTQLWRLLRDEQMPAALHTVLLGGAAIPDALTDAAGQRGIACFCGYGLTELASTVCAKRADGAADVGAALPGKALRIVNEEVWIRADSLASGYWQHGALQSLINNEGWFATRDRGQLHNGRLTILGRLDNLFFSGGEGIQPEAVERVIAAHPGVSQCMVVPVPDAEFGQRPVALVTCQPELLPELAQWVGPRLARFQQPMRWLPLPEALSRGGIKLSRQALQRWAEQRLAADALASGELTPYTDAGQNATRADKR